MTEIDGLLLLDKPAGCTSHDLVDRVRRKFGIKKVGHCGTLDPQATGLLMLLLGKATKMQALLMAEDKTYRGTMRLGVITDTQDADGKIIEERPVPDIDPKIIEAAFERYRGDFYQTPPMVSALKKDGVPLYKLARKGLVVEREPRLVHVYWSQIIKIDLPRVEFELRCSKGFYVRTYCDDIGKFIGTGACLEKLCRTASGNFRLDQAISWEKCEALDSLSALKPYIISPAEVSRIRRQ
ncbi:MAG: tRNA pseudouridine(55) synthase TruB [Methylacidiphilales bacterium]|nr:tRNA pseudouridine(55) synthase TruB [Candidatus Methylacidiphilales bacterium]MDW8348906.1 tRNA pseudouridine(55) synthase TruB [Verrucomicrobiae bacterium]